MTALSRPLLRWHGGKWRLAPWIIAHFPKHRVYVEPFGGAASVLLRKPRAYAEVYNDLDGDAVNLFRILRSDRAAELVDAIALTPFARDEFEEASEMSEDPLENARRLVARSFMGFGSDASNRAVKTGFRASAAGNGTSPARDWAAYPLALRATIDRLRGVVIERRDALEVMRQHDSPDALHYLDPPYMPATRSTKARRGGTRYHAYQHEMTEDDHAALLAALPGLQGMVVLSGYHTPLYDEALAGWVRVEKAALADGGRPRTEVLWLNQRASAGVQGRLSL